MFGSSKISDKELSKTVNKRLLRAGCGSKTALVAAVKNGTVSVAGVLKYESQRRPVLKAITNIAGVTRVIDQLKLASPTANH